MLKSLFWNFYATCYDALNQLRPYREMLMRVVTLLDIKYGENTLQILDAGCGTGNLEQVLQQWNVRITALDFSPVMLARAEEKNKDCSTIRFQQADLNQSLPFSDAVFDRVVCVNTLYILDNPDQIIKEFERVLKVGGLLVIVTPKKESSPSLILKAHRHRHESDDKWKTDNFFKWLWLVFRAFGMSYTTVRFIFVAVFNKKLFQVMRVFDKTELESLIMTSGLHVIDSCLVYGDQCILTRARKGGR